MQKMAEWSNTFPNSAFCIPNSAIPMRVAHLITRMIVGGAQENTLFNCEDLIRDVWR